MSADGRGVVGHAGARLVADVAEVTGLTGLFRDVLAVLPQRQGGHDPGRVAVDLAVMLADGGEAISDLAVLRDQAQLFGPVASDVEVRPAHAKRISRGCGSAAPMSSWWR